MVSTMARDNWNDPKLDWDLGYIDKIIFFFITRTAQG